MTSITLDQRINETPAKDLNKYITEKNTSSLTELEFKAAVPDAIKKRIDKKIINKVNAVMGDPDQYMVFRENILSFTNVLSKGRFKMESYVNAVRYVSLRLMDHSKLSAYLITFPDTLKRWELEDVVDSERQKAVSGWNRSKLVGMLYEQTHVPFWVVNQDNYQKAIDTQVSLMKLSQSDRVRCEAADSILRHLKPPETQKVEVEVVTSGESPLEALRRTTRALAEQQKLALETKVVSAEDIAESSFMKKPEKSEEDEEGDGDENRDEIEGEFEEIGNNV